MNAEHREPSNYPRSQFALLTVAFVFLVAHFLFTERLWHAPIRFIGHLLPSDWVTLLFLCWATISALAFVRGLRLASQYHWTRLSLILAALGVINFAFVLWTFGRLTGAVD